jgi:hypothetical protein
MTANPHELGPRGRGRPDRLGAARAHEHRAMSRWDAFRLQQCQQRTSTCGTNPTCRGGLTMSVDRGTPDGAGSRSE